MRVKEYRRVNKVIERHARNKFSKMIYEYKKILQEIGFNEKRVGARPGMYHDQQFRDFFRAPTGPIIQYSFAQDIVPKFKGKPFSISDNAIHL